MMRRDPSSPRRISLWAVALVALIHVAAVIALVRAFAPGLSETVTRNVVSAFTVTVTTPPRDEPKPSPTPQNRTPQKAGAAGEAGRQAVPREVAAPSPRIVLPTRSAPRVAGQGSAMSSGARDQGTGTGAGGQGAGTGSGTGGSGQGGGGAARAVKIAGEINSARDYPPASREQRLGDHVIVALTVGTDGRVKACRIHRASRDPEADRITCRLASDRFRFRPATDASGVPVQSTFGWQQSWYDPRDKKE